MRESVLYVLSEYLVILHSFEFIYDLSIYDCEHMGKLMDLTKKKLRNRRLTLRISVRTGNLAISI